MSECEALLLGLAALEDVRRACLDVQQPDLFRTAREQAERLHAAEKVLYLRARRCHEFEELRATISGTHGTRPSEVRRAA